MYIFYTFLIVSFFFLSYFYDFAVRRGVRQGCIQDCVSFALIFFIVEYGYGSLDLNLVP